MAQGKTLAELLVKIGADTTEFLKGMKSLEDNLKNIGQKASQIGRDLTTSLTLPMTLVGGAAIKMGMEAVESENLFEVSMKGMAGAARDWSENLSKSLGLNAFELRQNVGMLNTMFTSMKLGKQDAYDMSTGLTQLAYDMASLYNIKPEEAFDKLRSGISGMSEPLKQLGILVTDQTVNAYAYTHGIAKQGEQLNEVQKTMARYGVIMEATKDAQGDLARTAQSPTNQLRIMGEQVKQAGIQFGMALLPMLQEFIKMAQPMIQRLKDAVAWFSGLSDEQKRHIVTIGLVIAAIGPALLVFGKVISVVSSVIGIVRSLGVALQFLAANPVGIIITAIGLLILGGIELYKHWDQVKYYALQAWGSIKEFILNAAAKVVDAYAGFIGMFNAKAGETARAAAQHLRDMASAEQDVLTERSAAFAEAAQKDADAEKARQQHAQDTLKAQQDAANDYKNVQYDAAQYADEVASNSAATQKKYIDGFETEFSRAQDRITTDFQRAQEQQTTEFKRGQEDQLNDFKNAQETQKVEYGRTLDDKKTAFERALDDEKTAFERTQEDELNAFKESQQKQIDALQEKQDAARAALDSEYAGRIAAIQAQKDAIKAQEDEEANKKRLADLNGRIAQAEQDVAKARLTGNAEKIAQAEGKLADEKANLDEYLTAQARQQQQKRLDDQINALRAEQTTKQKALQDQQKDEMQALKDKQNAEALDFKRKQEDEKKNFETLQADRKTQYQQELDDLKTSFANKQAEALTAYQRSQENELSDWNAAQDRRAAQFKIELEDLKTSFEGKLALQKEYVQKSKDLDAALKDATADVSGTSTALATPTMAKTGAALIAAAEAAKSIAKTLGIDQAARFLASSVGISLDQARANLASIDLSKVGTSTTSVPSGTTTSAAGPTPSPKSTTIVTPVTLTVDGKTLAQATVTHIVGPTPQTARAT